MSMMEETKAKLESAGDSSDIDNGNCSSSGSGGDTKKTSRTPLWRGGPAGPKSLCNACGIKSRKKRQAAIGIRQDDNKIKSKNNNNLGLDNPSVNVKSKMIKTDADSSSKNKKNVKTASRFFDLGFKVPAMKRSAVEKKRLWRKLGEEEQAAVLLMTLSCG